MDAKDLLKSILRGILPNPVVNLMVFSDLSNKAVQFLLLYQMVFMSFAGLDPKTGEVIPEPPAPLQSATGEGSTKYDRIKSRMDRKRKWHRTKQRMMR